jgi:hypothetical protein
VFQIQAQSPDGTVVAISRPFSDKSGAVSGISAVREYAGMGLITDLCPGVPASGSSTWPPAVALRTAPAPAVGRISPTRRSSRWVHIRPEHSAPQLDAKFPPPDQAGLPGQCAWRLGNSCESPAPDPRPGRQTAAQRRPIRKPLSVQSQKTVGRETANSSCEITAMLDQQSQVAVKLSEECRNSKG